MNINPAFQRLSLLIGNDAASALAGTKVIIFGLGGVGSWCAEALVRSGIGSIILVDYDTIDITNINRQIEATAKTIGLAKTEVLAARLKEINPECNVDVIDKFFSCQGNNDNKNNLEIQEKTAMEFGIPNADYIIDAIDSIESKLDLIECAVRCGVTLFSSMGMALRLDPTRLRTADIWETSGCPLARRVREGLRKRGFSANFTAVYSDEKPITPGDKKINGSAVTVTAAAGMILASLVIRDIFDINRCDSNRSNLNRCGES
ncbi:MAG: tRNA threonylcarbamoyladenosine dehydratase [Treponema sp.]|nr:tRNA threonylcarbamoyladenosine dehydratase [Treponema sp.]